MDKSSAKPGLWGTHFENLWCTGLFLVLSFSTVSSLAGSQGAEPPLLSSFAMFIRAAAFLGVALVARNIGSLIGRPRLLVAAAAAMGLCLLGRIFSFALEDGAVRVALSFGLVAISNGCVAVLYLAWMEFYAQMDMRHGLAFLCVVHLGSALTSFGLFSLAVAPIAGAVAALLPMVSVKALFRADCVTKGAPFRQGEGVDATPWTMSPRPLVLLGAFTLTNTFLRSFLGVQDRAFVLLGVCVAAFAVLAVAARCFGSFEPKALYEVSVPVLIAGTMFVLVAIPGANVAAAFCSNAAFTLFSIFIAVVFCAISYRYGVNALWLFGITQAALTSGSLLGSLLSRGEALLSLSGAGATAPIAVLVVVLVALSMLLVSDRDFETTWGVTPRQDTGEAPSALEGEELEMRRCAKAAKLYGLTRREEEILLLLMRGQTLARIAAELYVAESTMKTHSRHIYRKAGVANRQELQERIEGIPV